MSENGENQRGTNPLFEGTINSTCYFYNAAKNIAKYQTQILLGKYNRDVPLESERSGGSGSRDVDYRTTVFSILFSSPFRSNTTFDWASLLLLDIIKIARTWQGKRRHTSGVAPVLSYVYIFCPCKVRAILTMPLDDLPGVMAYNVLRPPCPSPTLVFFTILH